MAPALFRGMWLKDVAISQESRKTWGPSVEPQPLRLIQRQMRASGALVEVGAYLGRNDQCISGLEVGRVKFRPQVFGGMEVADL